MQHIPKRIGQRSPCSKKDFSCHIGRAEGGLNSKQHTVCDVQSRPVRLHLTAGQVSDFKGQMFFLMDLPEETAEAIGNRSYDSNRIRWSLARQNITACIPPKKNRQSTPPYNCHLYKKRHLIENMFARPATCCDQIRPVRSHLHVYNPDRSKLHFLSQRMSPEPRTC